MKEVKQDIAKFATDPDDNAEEEKMSNQFLPAAQAYEEQKV